MPKLTQVAPQDVPTEGMSEFADKPSPPKDATQPDEPKAATTTTTKTRPPKQPDPLPPTVPDFSDIDLSTSLQTQADDDDEYVSVLYWGPYGTTKTTSIAAMSRLSHPGKLVVVNAEGGLKDRALRDWDIDTDRIVPFPRPGQQLTYDLLEKLFYRMAHDFESNPKAYLGIAWDSVTAIHQYLLDQVIDADIAEQRLIIEQARKVNRRAGNIQLRNRFETEGDDYNLMSQQVKHLLRQFRFLPCHFATSALVRTENAGKRNEKHMPAVNPALQNDLAGYVDIVVRTGVWETDDGLVYFGRTVGGDTEDNKDRYHKLPPLLVEPSFDRIVAYVRGDLTADTDPLQRRLDGLEGVPAVGKKVPAPPPKPSGGKLSADKAKQQVQQETEPAKPTRQTAAQKRAAAKAEAAKTTEAAADEDQPPY